jgi:hypothetical protein
MGGGGAGGGAPFRVPWSSLLKAAFRDGQDELPLGKLRKRVIKAAVEAAQEAGAPAPDRCGQWQAKGHDAQGGRCCALSVCLTQSTQRGLEPGLHHGAHLF